MGKLIYSIAVIGGGSAGVMSVNRALLNNDQCLFLSGGKNEKRKSRALWVKKVENIPGHLQYNRGITEPNDEMLKWLKQSPFGKNLFHIQKSVIQLQWINSDQCFEIIDEDQEVFYSKYLVLCTGIMDIQPKIAGSIQPILPFANNQDVDYCLRCDGHHVLGKEVGIIGHSSAAAWVAIMLHERYSPPSITLFLNGETSTITEDEKKLCERYNIAIQAAEIKQLVADEKRKLKSVMLQTDVNCSVQICFVSLGVMVYNQLALQLGAKVDERGFILTDEYGQSSVDKLYVAGDLRAGKKKQIYTAWDTAVDALDQINVRMRKEKRLKK